MEKAITTPHRKEYNGPTFDLSKEALQTTIDNIKNMDANTVKKRLGDYKDIDFNSRVTKDINTFEMMALYQRALNLLGSQITINARFSTATLTALKGVQEHKLEMKGNNIDGLPGSTTTKALINALEKLSTSATKPAVVPAPVASTLVKPAPVPEAPTSTPAKPATRLDNLSDPRSTQYVKPAPAAATPASAPASKPVAPAPKVPISAPSLTAKPDFLLEQLSARDAIQNAQKPSMINPLSGNGSFYNGSSPKHIDYAMIGQSDGEFYVFDKPNQGKRMVYRMQNNQVIGSLQIDASGAIIQEKGEKMKNVLYMPTPVILSK